MFILNDILPLLLKVWQTVIVVCNEFAEKY
jgi:hypothetical protein